MPLQPPPPSEQQTQDAPKPFVTDEIAALVGRCGPRLTAATPLDPDGLRRFVQAVMEGDPLHWDADRAAQGRYGTLVAPPLYPMHALRRAPGAPDPFDRLAAEPDWDGLDTRASLGGLPGIDIPELPRILNGGTEARFFGLVRLGDTVSAQSRYVEIVDKQGRSGPMVVVTVETEYTNQDDELLARVRKTLIMR